VGETEGGIFSTLNGKSVEQRLQIFLEHLQSLPEAGESPGECCGEIEKSEVLTNWREHHPAARIGSQSALGRSKTPQLSRIGAAGLAGRSR